MDWKIQLGISIILPIISSILTYLGATKKSKDEIKAVQIKADNEIEKIREASDKEIERMRADTEEQIKLKLTERELASKENDEKMKNDMAAQFMENFINNPKKGMETFNTLQDLVKMFPTDGKK